MGGGGGGETGCFQGKFSPSIRALAVTHFQCGLPDASIPEFPPAIFSDSVGGCRLGGGGEQKPCFAPRGAAEPSTGSKLQASAFK